MKFLDLIEQLFAAYGYLVLLAGLPLDAIASPIPPGNTTLTYTGYLSYKGILHWLPALLSAYAGSILGTTATYWLGNKLGVPLVKRYGRWLFLTPERLEKTKKAYDKHGNKVLLISYFLPGVRQCIGYFAGIIHVPFRVYALYAYAGSALWVLVFFSIGYMFGDQWELIFLFVEQFLMFFLAAVIGITAIVLLLKLRGSLAVRSDKQEQNLTSK